MFILQNVDIGCTYTMSLRDVGGRRGGFEKRCTLLTKKQKLAVYVVVPGSASGGEVKIIFNCKQCENFY